MARFQCGPCGYDGHAVWVGERVCPRCGGRGCSRGRHAQVSIERRGMRWAAIRILGWAAFLLFTGSHTVIACDIRNFHSIEIAPSAEPDWVVALEVAYPGLKVAPDGTQLTTPSGQRLPTGSGATERGPAERLVSSSIVEQFAQAYPLVFDLEARKHPWQDPGRARNEALFRALYGENEAEIRASLVRVSYPRGKASFFVSRSHCAAAQLQAALNEIAAMGAVMDIYFERIGGSFNWRLIAGTSRLSGHSFGMAVDLNTELGGYWRWSGAAEGEVPDYDNRFPEALVVVMERHGYIWGGKWHHFDGMHFEYRPELIIHARLVGTQVD